METALIEIESATGLIIPDELLAEMQLKPGAKVTLMRKEGGFFVKALDKKHKLNIKDLMANTDFESQRNDPELQAWQAKSRVKHQ
ncbi:hypothetical protein [Vibrio splendidus]|uniref:AbrB/MazE/SpoVT family DNA-binding domain-containing protein n=1 Tax=Vibrio splendidus TaxID=29497 RepID=UPI000C837428|nr:hypothetical protein [Vibrio splendidus]PMI54419.1 hypothetical protein BCU42_17970 [Vibrio splendidus]